MSFWLLVILLLILLNHCLGSGKQILLNSCWRSDDLMLLNSHFCNLATSLLLSSNNKVCSFIWIRGNKHSFLTSFTNFYHCFLFLVFSRCRYLLVSSHLSRLHGTPISYPVFIHFVLWILRRTCAPMFLAHLTRFLEVRHSWELGTKISTGIPSPFRLSFQRFLVQMSIRQFANHTFSSHLNPRTDIFLHDISLR